MRCPACTQRNSVAARNCKFCGAKFKPSSPEVPLKALAGVVAVGLVIGASSMVGSFFSGGGFGGKPAPKLKPIAERMAAGPKTPEDAQLMRVELDNAVVAYLQQHGSLPSSDLLTKLQSEVPSSAFEVLVFDLPNNIKLVELACVLQPSDYLVVPGKAGAPNVTRVAGLSVFDAARVIDAKPDPALVILGHSTGEKAGEPQFKAIALLASGETTDKSDKLFPHIKGTGTAKFIDATNDIKIDRSVVSSAKDENLFDKSVNFKDEPFTTTLTWQNGTYKPSVSLGSSEIGALYAVASSLVDPTETEVYRQQLSSQVKDVLKGLEDKPVVAPGSFKITKVTKEAAPRRRRSRRSAGGEGLATYILSTSTRGFEVGLLKAGRWSATTLKETEVPAEVAAVATEPAVQTPAVAEKPVEETPVAKVETPPEPKVVERAPEPKIVERAPEPKVVERAPEPKVVERVRERTKETTKVATISGAGDSERVSDRKRDRDRKNDSERSERSEARSKSESRETESANRSKKGSGVASEVARRVTMRTGPARQNAAVMDVSKGATVRILEEKNHWYKISADGKEGWVYSSYVKRGSGKSSGSNVASKPEESEPTPSRRESERERERERAKKVTATKPAPPKPSTKTTATKTTATKTITATTSSVDKSKKSSSKSKTQISSSKPHAAPKEASDEPDFVP
ncbi:MAG: SH3 domain-containing protein [Candidatus Melainabacteria bacterium]|nr:SH3 domain-containing protein [Candidatus Melainabacteria bacterium]